MSGSSKRYILLAVNAGSSSLKISVYARAGGHESLKLLASSSFTSIASPPTKFTFNQESTSVTGGSTITENVDGLVDHASCFQHFLAAFSRETNIGQSQILYVLHRLVHGGDFSTPAEITNESIDYLERLSDLAPLHNGPALSVVKASTSALPNAKGIAYFDSTFHRSLPHHISSFAINQDIARSRGLKKYGFHGLSYSFILRSVSEYLGRPEDELNLIMLHLGSGASACAVQHGKALDTSMGLTPLQGLPGATRSGSIDPSLIFHYTNKAGRMSHDPSLATDVHLTQAEDILNRKAGWSAMTGTPDFGTITARADLNNQAPEIACRNPYRLAFDLFVDRLLNYIGAYHLKLGGQVDALVFAGGIGEKATRLRQIVGEKVLCLGYQPVSKTRNEAVGSEASVYNISVECEGSGGTAGSSRRILVCRTDEQYEMARECSMDKNLWEFVDTQ